MRATLYGPSTVQGNWERIHCVVAITHKERTSAKHADFTWFVCEELQGRVNKAGITAEVTPSISSVDGSAFNTGSQEAYDLLEPDFDQILDKCLTKFGGLD